MFARFAHVDQHAACRLPRARLDRSDFLDVAHGRSLAAQPRVGQHGHPVAHRILPCPFGQLDQRVGVGRSAQAVRGDGGVWRHLQLAAGIAAEIAAHELQACMRLADRRRQRGGPGRE